MEYKFTVTTNAGEFTFKPLSVGEQISLRSAARAIYGGPLPAEDDPDSRSMEASAAWFIAEMRLAAIEVPGAWKWEQGYSIDPLLELWKEYREKRDSFRKGMGVNEASAGA